MPGYYDALEVKKSDGKLSLKPSGYKLRSGEQWGGNTAGIKTEFVEGLRFDRGFISPYFALNRADGCILNNPLIFVTDKGIADQDTAVTDRKSTRLNSSHSAKSRMPSSA